MQFIVEELFIYLFIYMWLQSSVYLCKRQDIAIVLSVYCFNIFGSTFGALFYLLIRKFILGSKTIWKSMRFSGAVEVWGRFLICAKKKHDFFFENCTLVWSWDQKFTIKCENLATNFYETKGINFWCPQMI